VQQLTNRFFSMTIEEDDLQVALKQLFLRAKQTNRSTSAPTSINATSPSACLRDNAMHAKGVL
jgi:hypothetical protein